MPARSPKSQDLHSNVSWQRSGIELPNSTLQLLSPGACHQCKLRVKSTHTHTHTKPHTHTQLHTHTHTHTQLHTRKHAWNQQRSGQSAIEAPNKNSPSQSTSVYAYMPRVARLKLRLEPRNGRYAALQVVLSRSSQADLVVLTLGSQLFISITVTRGQLGFTANWRVPSTPQLPSSTRPAKI